jgi:hypothetical protein
MEEVKPAMNWKKLLESASESVNDHLRLRNAYLLAENRILRRQIDGRMQLTESERKELAEIGVKLGKQALAEIVTIVTPDTIFAWHRMFADQTVDTSQPRKLVGRPRVDKEVEDLVVRLARENCTWGYDRIQGSLKHLGYTIRDQTVGNILKRHSIPPAPERKKTLTWREFVRFHLDVLRAMDFCNSELWNWFCLLISYLEGFLRFSRYQDHAIELWLHRQMQGMRSVLIQSLNLSVHAQRWSCWVKTGVRSQTRRCGQALLGSPVTACAPSEARSPQYYEMGKVVRLSDISSGLIRAGLLRYRRRFRGPSHLNDCEAA